MKACEIKYLKEASAEVKAKINKLIENASSIEGLIDAWFFGEGHSISFFDGIDDENPALALTGVAIFIEDQRIAEIYYKKEEILKLYPDVKPVTSYIRGIDSFEGIELDDKEFQKWERSIGFDYSHALANLLGPRKSMVPYILPYILSDGGDISINKASNSWAVNLDEIDQDLKSEGLEMGMLAIIDAHYQTPHQHGGTFPGWGCCSFIRTDI